MWIYYEISISLSVAHFCIGKSIIGNPIFYYVLMLYVAVRMILSASRSLWTT